MNRPTFTACRFAALVLAAGAVALHGAEGADSEGARFFLKEVRPLLEESCFKCHGAEAKIKGGLRLTTLAGVLTGGDTGPAVERLKPGESLLLKMISWSDDDHQMPPKKKLGQDKIDLLAKWVKLGAPWGGEGGEAPVATAPGASAAADAEAKNYWFYQKPQQVAVPAVKDQHWGRTPIDAFILNGLEAKGLRPEGEADRRVLIRRATYDLTGLPPSPDEVELFAKDSSPDAYEKLVDRLLASPHYGEKWGRYWLDVVGYAETNGYERDGNKPNAWRYRDYVIRALNQDKPYDQFLREQLAGDQFDKPTADSITATGYYRLGLWDDEPADHEQLHYDVLDGIVSTTAQAMLGMTMGCARCHNHKKDPLLQEDYYRLLAFFHGIKPMANDGPNIETEISRDAGSIAAFEQKVSEMQAQSDQIEDDFRKKFDAKGGAPARDIEELAYRYYRGAWETLPRFDELKAESQGKLPRGLFDLSSTTRDSDYGFVFSGSLVVPTDGHYTFTVDSDDGSRLTIAGKQVLEYDGIHGVGSPKRCELDLHKGRVAIRLDYFQHVGGFGLAVSWAGPGVKDRALCAGDSKEQGFAELFKARGAELIGKDAVERYRKLQKSIEELKRNPPGVEKALSASEGGMRDTFVLVRGNPHVQGKQVQPGFPRVLGFADPPKSAKPRLALADWMVNADNPTPARVMVNRLWQGHFGKGIVVTANDFGKFGQLPSNQPLLDWLARAFVAGGWKIKSMHRLMMTSSAYRMSSHDDATNLAKDPENELVWRFPMRRLTAEEIRDSILATGGSLNPGLFGPSVFPPMPTEVLATSSHPGDVWGKSSGDDAARRSIYIKVKRSLLYPMLAAHDFADTDTSCPVRFSTTVPTQALTMMNSAFIVDQAGQFADRLRKQAGENIEQQARLGLRLVTQRPPLDAEVKRALGFVTALRDKNGLSAERSLDLLCLMLLNLNEFVYLD